MTTNRIDLPDVFRRAAQIIQTQGHHQGDYIPDPRNRILRALPHERPMSIVAALRCAETGQPLRFGPVSTGAVAFLAGRLLVDGEPPFWTDDLSLESHVAAWGDVPGRTPGEAVEVLLAAAEAAPAPRAGVVPQTVTTADGTEWALWSVPAEGEPTYTVAGVRGGPGAPTVELAELVMVSTGGAW